MTRMKILVIANEIVDGSALEPDAQVFVVAPALNSRLRHWLSDVDGARRDAERRLARTLELLARGGVVARGRVGDSDPLQAVADALPFFEAESILVSGLGNWLARDLVRVREPLDRESLAPAQPEALGGLAVFELQRQHAHAEEVRAVDALKALGDYGPHAE